MLLKRGSRGKDVIKLQNRLMELGFFNATSTGYYGTVTEKAVYDFQEDYNKKNNKNIKVDGITGDTTWGLLFTPDNVSEPTTDKKFSFNKITPEIVKLLIPNAPIVNIQKYLPGIMDSLKRHNLNDKDMFLMAMGTVSAETEVFKPLDEYISKYNTPPGGEPYSKYDFREDLGNNRKGDGARYKGRGFIQLTGKYNYKNYGKILIKLGLTNKSLAEYPDLANDPILAAEILVLFLKDRETKIRIALSNGDLVTARKLVNGGTHGLNSFSAIFDRADEVFE